MPASFEGMQTDPAQSAANQGMAILTDPLGRVTTYTLDSLGLEPPGSRLPTVACRPSSATSPANRRSPPMSWAA